MWLKKLAMSGCFVIIIQKQLVPKGNNNYKGENIGLTDWNVFILKQETIV